MARARAVGCWLWAGAVGCGLGPVCLYIVVLIYIYIYKYKYKYKIYVAASVGLYEATNMCFAHTCVYSNYSTYIHEWSVKICYTQKWRQRTSSSMHFSNFGSCNRCSMIQKADQVSQCTDAGYVAVERHFLASCLCTVHGAKRTGLFHGWCSPSMRLEFDLVV